MGFLDKIKGFEEEAYIELDVEEGEPSGKKMLIEIERMDNYNDSDRIQRKVREGTILLVKVKDLRAKDMTELKRAIEKVKKTCLAVDGDIAGIGNDWIVVCPRTVKVHRELVE
jgi:SepF-like predicted cell division protein (DUF552 family)